MYDYQLTGKIHPERVNFTIGTKLPLYIEHKDFGIKGEVVLEVKESNLFVSFSSKNIYSSLDTSALETLKNIIEESVRIIVDAYCYVRSYAYELEITNIKCRDLNLEYQFGVRGEWNINKDDKHANEEFSKLINLFTTPENTPLCLVFADFRRSIKYPSMTASFCFRAIETIRQHAYEDISILDDDKRRKAGWKELGKELGFTEKDFDEIKKFALPNRHGKYPTITYTERERIMNFTRRVIDKSIHQILSESKQLQD
jgi:hypothetical protein